jgi:hypothetical protein
VSSTTCPTCRQLVARDALGIRPHAYHGAPCDGGRPAPVIAPPEHHIALTPMVLAGRARRQAQMDEAKARRDAIVAPLLPAPTADLQRAAGMKRSAVIASCRRIGAVLDWGKPRVWRLA